MVAASITIVRRFGWTAGAERAPAVQASLLALSGLAYVAMAATAQSHSHAMRLCAEGTGAIAPRILFAVSMLLRAWPACLIANAEMVMAMSAPLLIAPWRLVAMRSFPSRRSRSLVVMTSAYLLVWLVMMALLDLAAALLAATIGDAGLIFVASLAAAAFWQASSIKAWLLGLCHRVPELEPIGARADLSCAEYGLSLGVICVGACAPLMLCSLLAPIGWLSCLCGGVVAFIERFQDRPPNVVISVGLILSTVIELVGMK